AGHVEEAKAIGGKRSGGGGAEEAIVRRILIGEAAFPDVRLPFSPRKAIVAPGEAGSLSFAPRGVLPFRFRRQALAGPVRISNGIVPTNLHSRMILLSFNRACRPFGMTPIRSGDIPPPDERIIE